MTPNPIRIRKTLPTCDAKIVPLVIFVGVPRATLFVLISQSLTDGIKPINPPAIINKPKDNGISTLLSIK